MTRTYPIRRQAANRGHKLSVAIAVVIAERVDVTAKYCAPGWETTALSTYRIIDVPDYTHVAEDIVRLRGETHPTPKRRKT